jgi:hypothetical protein
MIGNNIVNHTMRMNIVGMSVLSGIGGMIRIIGLATTTTGNASVSVSVTDRDRDKEIIVSIEITGDKITGEKNIVV